MRAFFSRTIRVSKLAARDGRIPRPIRWLAALGSCPCLDHVTKRCSCWSGSSCSLSTVARCEGLIRLRPPCGMRKFDLPGNGRFSERPGLASFVGSDVRVRSPGLLRMVRRSVWAAASGSGAFPYLYGSRRAAARAQEPRLARLTRAAISRRIGFTHPTGFRIVLDASPAPCRRRMFGLARCARIPPKARNPPNAPPWACKTTKGQATGFD
jgi:hypothetical protein